MQATNSGASIAVFQKAPRLIGRSGTLTLTVSSYNLALIAITEDEGDTVDTRVGWARCPEVMMVGEETTLLAAIYANNPTDVIVARSGPARPM